MILHIEDVTKWLAHSRYLVLTCCVVGWWAKSEWRNERACSERRNESFRDNREEGYLAPSLRGEFPELSLTSAGRGRLVSLTGTEEWVCAPLLPPHISTLRKCSHPHGTASASDALCSQDGTWRSGVLERMSVSKSNRNFKCTCHTVF